MSDSDSDGDADFEPVRAAVASRAPPTKAPPAGKRLAGRPDAIAAPTSPSAAAAKAKGKPSTPCAAAAKGKPLTPSAMAARSAPPPCPDAKARAAKGGAAQVGPTGKLFSAMEGKAAGFSILQSLQCNLGFADAKSAPRSPPHSLLKGNASGEETASSTASPPPESEEHESSMNSATNERHLSAEQAIEAPVAHQLRAEAPEFVPLGPSPSNMMGVPSGMMVAFPMRPGQQMSPMQAMQAMQGMQQGMQIVGPMQWVGADTLHPSMPAAPHQEALPLSVSNAASHGFDNLELVPDPLRGLPLGAQAPLDDEDPLATPSPRGMYESNEHLASKMEMLASRLHQGFAKS